MVGVLSEAPGAGGGPTPRRQPLQPACPAAGTVATRRPQGPGATNTGVNPRLPLGPPAPANCSPAGPGCRRPSRRGRVRAQRPPRTCKGRGPGSRPHPRPLAGHWASPAPRAAPPGPPAPVRAEQSCGGCRGGGTRGWGRRRRAGPPTLPPRVPPVSPTDERILALPGRDILGARSRREPFGLSPQSGPERGANAARRRARRAGGRGPRAGAPARTAGAAGERAPSCGRRREAARRCGSDGPMRRRPQRPRSRPAGPGCGGGRGGPRAGSRRERERGWDSPASGSG